VRQSLFQRRAGLVTVIVATGAGAGGYAAIDLDAADAARLLDATGVAPRTVLSPDPVAPETGATRITTLGP
jgi:putative membrane protein